MNVIGIVKWMGGVSLTLALFSTSAGTGAVLTACGESSGCTQLRTDTYALLEQWGQCDPDIPLGDCIIEPGNPKDCTGVLACPFAINPLYRSDAEQRMLTMGQQSQGCYLCAIPNCPQGDLAWCEPVSHRCMVISALLDGGAVISETTLDSGGSGLSPDVASPEPGADGSSE
jgi:hypothetical protein